MKFSALLLLLLCVPAFAGTFRFVDVATGNDNAGANTCVAAATTTGSTTASSQTLTVSSATGIANGQTVFGNGIPAATTVTNVVSTTVTLSTNATATASGVTVYFSLPCKTIGNAKAKVLTNSGDTVIVHGGDYTGEGVLNLCVATNAANPIVWQTNGAANYTAPAFGTGTTPLGGPAEDAIIKAGMSSSSCAYNTVFGFDFTDTTYATARCVLISGGSNFKFFGNHVHDCGILTGANAGVQVGGNSAAAPNAQIIGNWVQWVGAKRPIFSGGTCDYTTTNCGASALAISYYGDYITAQGNFTDHTSDMISGGGFLAANVGNWWLGVYCPSSSGAVGQGAIDDQAHCDLPCASPKGGNCAGATATNGLHIDGFQLGPTCSGGLTVQTVGSLIEGNVVEVGWLLNMHLGILQNGTPAGPTGSDASCRNHDTVIAWNQAFLINGGLSCDQAAWWGCKEYGNTYSNLNIMGQFADITNIAVSSNVATVTASCVGGGSINCTPTPSSHFQVGQLVMFSGLTAASSLNSSSSSIKWFTVCGPPTPGCASPTNLSYTVSVSGQGNVASTAETGTVWSTGGDNLAVFRQYGIFSGYQNNLSYNSPVNYMSNGAQASAEIYFIDTGANLVSNAGGDHNLDYKTGCAPSCGYLSQMSTRTGNIVNSDPLLVNPLSNLSPNAGSPALGAGSYLASTTAASPSGGSSPTSTIVVDDASWFYPGNGNGVNGQTVVLSSLTTGITPTASNTTTITSIDYTHEDFRIATVGNPVSGVISFTGTAVAPGGGTGQAPSVGETRTLINMYYGSTTQDTTLQGLVVTVCDHNTTGCSDPSTTSFTATYTGPVPPNIGNERGDAVQKPTTMTVTPAIAFGSGWHVFPYKDTQGTIHWNAAIGAPDIGALSYTAPVSPSNITLHATGNGSSTSAGYLTGDNGVKITWNGTAATCVAGSAGGDGLSCLESVANNTAFTVSATAAAGSGVASISCTAPLGSCTCTATNCSGNVGTGNADVVVTFVTAPTCTSLTTTANNINYPTVVTLTPTLSNLQVPWSWSINKPDGTAIIFCSNSNGACNPAGNAIQITPTDGGLYTLYAYSSGVICPSPPSQPENISVSQSKAAH